MYRLPLCEDLRVRFPVLGKLQRLLRQLSWTYQLKQIPSILLGHAFAMGMALFCVQGTKKVAYATFVKGYILMIMRPQLSHSTISSLALRTRCSTALGREVLQPEHWPFTRRLSGGVMCFLMRL